jgi:hypothetical protein
MALFWRFEVTKSRFEVSFAEDKASHCESNVSFSRFETPSSRDDALFPQLEITSRQNKKALREIEA